MGHIIVVAFDNPDEAQQVASSFAAVARDGGVKLNDLQVVVKDAEGKLHAKDEAGHPVAWGALAGGVLGGLLFFMMPVVGIAAGAALGGYLGHSLTLNIDKKFIDDVAANLQPNTSAIFMVVSDENQAAVLNALKDHKGKLIQTSVSSDMEDQLKRVLSD
jgi:uncharacterized membrane protein